MRPNRDEALAWEARWLRPAALATFAGVALAVAAIVIATQVVGANEGSAELLVNADEHRAATWIAAVLQAIGVGLLAAPLYLLFRAANARSETMRGQLVGVVVAAPLFLAVAALLFAAASLDAASQFVEEDLPGLTQRGVELGSDRAEEVADDAVSGASLSPLAAGFELGGRLGFVVAMFYTALHAMRAGLLTRFWGSLGLALGAVSFLPLFRPFTLIWFLYLGLLFAGWLPGGRPPAWQTGEAMPWPTPGEKAAAELEERSADDEKRG